MFPTIHFGTQKQLIPHQSKTIEGDVISKGKPIEGYHNATSLNPHPALSKLIAEIDKLDIPTILIMGSINSPDGLDESLTRPPIKDKDTSAQGKLIGKNELDLGSIMLDMGEIASKGLSNEDIKQIVDSMKQNEYIEGEAVRIEESPKLPSSNKLDEQG